MALATLWLHVYIFAIAPCLLVHSFFSNFSNPRINSGYFFFASHVARCGLRQSGKRYATFTVALIERKIQAYHEKSGVIAESFRSLFCTLLFWLWTDGWCVRYRTTSVHDVTKTVKKEKKTRRIFPIAGYWPINWMSKDEASIKKSTNWTILLLRNLQ